MAPPSPDLSSRRLPVYQPAPLAVRASLRTNGAVEEEADEDEEDEEEEEEEEMDIDNGIRNVILDPSRPNPQRPVSAPAPSSYDHDLTCTSCGRLLHLPATSPSPSQSHAAANRSSSPAVVSANGPLMSAAFESGIDAVSELMLLKEQVQDVARVCTAVANGDLSQKIEVTVQGAVMVQLKRAINTMVDRLARFAQEVTRVSQEVGTDG